MKVFKVNLSVVYNDNEITSDMICENMFQTMSKLNDKIVVLNIDDIKEMARPNQVITKMLKDIVKEPKENIKSGIIENNEYLEINKSSSEEKNIIEDKKKEVKKSKFRKSKKNENPYKLCK